MNKKVLDEICFDPLAAKLFKNFVQGCVTSDTKNKTLALFDNPKLSLNKIQKDLPVSAVGLYALAKHYGTKTITPEMVFEYYMGDSHIRDAILKINNPDFLITKTKKTLSEILKELEIDISKVTNKAMFLLSDIALLGEIQSFEKNNHRLCTVAVDDPFGDFLLFYRVVIPSEILSKLKKDDHVLVHLGYVGCKVDKKYFNTIAILSKKQFDYPEIMDAYKKIHRYHESYIEYNKFCSKGKKNCNLTKLQFENYYNK